MMMSVILGGFSLVGSCFHLDPSCFSNAPSCSALISLAFCCLSRNFCTPLSYMTEVLFREPIEVTEVSLHKDLSLGPIEALLLPPLEGNWFYRDRPAGISLMVFILVLILTTLDGLKREGLKEQSFKSFYLIFSCSIKILDAFSSFQSLVRW